MVSFSCEVCSDVFKKPKLDSHAARCHGAYYTCIDCSKTFIEGQWKDHTSCISEAEKYQGSLYKPEKGKGKGGKRREDGTTTANATVTTTVPVVKKVRIAVPEVTDAEIKRSKKDKDKKDKDKKDKKRKGSLEEIATPIAEVDEAQAKDIPMADAPAIESPDQPKSSEKEGKEKKEKKEKRKKREKRDKKDKDGKDRKDKKDKKDKKKSKDTPATLENSPDFTPVAAEAVDNKKRKSDPAEDAPAKKKKGEAGKAKLSQERLVELVGDEELGIEGFLDRLEMELGESLHDFDPQKEMFGGLRVKVDDGKVVISYKG